MYIYAYTYTYIYAYTYTHIYMNTCTHMHVHTTHTQISYCPKLFEVYKIKILFKRLIRSLRAPRESPTKEYTWG